METAAAKQNDLCRLAMEAEQTRRMERAAELYRKAITCDDSNPTPYLFLGFVLEKLEEAEAAAQVWSLAADLDPRLANAWRNTRLTAAVRQRSKAADSAIRAHYTALHSHTMANYMRDHPGADIARIEAAIWCQTHAAPFRYPVNKQRPHVFLVPQLEPISVFNYEHLPWRGALEDAATAIGVEFRTARELAMQEARPYLNPEAANLGDGWQAIANSLNWGALHLYKQGVANTRILNLFPETLAALERVPLLQTDKGPSEILFSILEGGQHIPPHYGLANTDVTVHLPLETNEKCAIKVCDKAYTWEAGKVFAFDDAFWHESWNYGEYARVNLLFEAWHPDLTEAEQGAIRATFAARERWNLDRRY